MSERLQEKCAVAGISANAEHDVSPETYHMLFALQHRGSEASGMTTQSGAQLFHEAGPGMVRDFYTDTVIGRLRGNVAIGHNRYTTHGDTDGHLQPIFDKQIGLSFAHNGNLPDTDQLQKYLLGHNLRAPAMNDSEMMAATVSHSIRNGLAMPDAVEQSYSRFEGAFSCVALHDNTISAFRDPCGIRPLAIGRLENDGHVVASETCALDIIGAEYVDEVAPGELVTIDGANIYRRQIVEGNPRLDVFELVYFARHDSYLYGKSVNEVRRQFGKRLALEHEPIAESENTLVVPIPDTSVPAAEGYAEVLGLPHRQAVMKNRFIANRTFMQQSDKERQSSLWRKHNVIPEAMVDRDVVLIDDSIVRLNTMPRLVELAREAGARTVQVLIASPPVRFPDYYGIDTPSQSELAAAHMTIEQIRRETQADYLGYLSLSGMVEATGISQDRFNLSSFNGEYPIDIGKRTREIQPPVSMEGAE